jgi:hypothetical protein
VSDAYAWLDEVHADVERLKVASITAAEKAIDFIYNSTLDRARRDPNWSDLADYIEVWSQDGQMVIGVRDQEFESQAFTMEYGDDQHPPIPLFRTGGEEDARRAGEIMTEHMESIFGWNL